MSCFTMLTGCPSIIQVSAEALEAEDKELFLKGMTQHVERWMHMSLH